MTDKLYTMEYEQPSLGTASKNDSSDAITVSDSAQEMSINDATFEMTENGSADKMVVKDSSDNITRSDSQDGTCGNNSLDDTSEIDATNSGVERTFADDIELPSTVTDRKQIFMPLDIKKDDPRIFGKWMLFTNGDLNLQDHMWIQLQTLLLGGDIILLESSTARKCRERGRFQGVIKCYTCEDKEVIKRAGIAIQGIIKDGIILNYKTNQASKDSLYRGYGDRFITKYMLTVNGKFYEKDKMERWKQVTDIHAENTTDEENSTGHYVPPVYLPPHRRSQLLGTELFPSQETAKKRYVYPKYASLNNFSGVWSMFCNAVDTDGGDVTELDRAWQATKVLCDEGFFTSTSCETSAFKPQPGENLLRRSITCELENYLNIDLVTQSGDKLRERTSYNLPMYFKICYHNDAGKMKYNLKYLYTDDGDLYEYVEERWRLLKKSGSISR